MTAILYVDTAVNRPWLWKEKTEFTGQPHMIRLAAVLERPGLEDVEIDALIPPPPGDPITADGTKQHGLTQDAVKNPKALRSLKSVMEQVQKLAEIADLMVAHSLAFHDKVLQRSAIETGEMLVLPPGFCTMIESRNICRLGQVMNGQWKWPKLTEAYGYFVGQEMLKVPNPIAAGRVQIEAVRAVYAGIMKDRAGT